MASLRPNTPLQPADQIRPPTNQGPLRSLGDPLFGVDEAAVARMNAANANPSSTNNSILAPPTAQTGAQFTTLAPNSSANTFGDFVPPNPASLASDPYTQFRLSENQRAVEHGAAAHGTLLSGGLLRSLSRYQQGIASEEAQNDFNRSLAAYKANQDTNAQNYGQAHTTYQDELDAFRANQNGLPAGTSTPGSRPIEPGGSTLGALTYGPSLGDDYAEQVAASRAAAIAPPPPPRPANYLPFGYREARPGIR